MKWNEMKWNSKMKWNEMKWNEVVYLPLWQFLQMDNSGGQNSYKYFTVTNSEKRLVLGTCLYELTDPDRRL